MRRLQMKPVRTSSGVAPVTVLTKPAGCPGRCIFCPDADEMPKSYLPNEPGARRAAQCGFDPYRQVITRLSSFQVDGPRRRQGRVADPGRHVERLLEAIPAVVCRALPAGDERGGPRCSAADLPPLTGETGQETMESPALLGAQTANEAATHRNVGLVVETRPDWVTPAEVAHMRRLGVTKVQLGVQSLDDRILTLNQRGHDVEAVRRGRAAAARRRLQAARALDAEPARRHARVGPGRTSHGCGRIPRLRPDELKIYPCSIIEGTELYARGRQASSGPTRTRNSSPSSPTARRPSRPTAASTGSSATSPPTTSWRAARGPTCGSWRFRARRAGPALRVHPVPGGAGTRVGENDLRLAVVDYDTDSTQGAIPELRDGGRRARRISAPVAPAA